MAAAACARGGGYTLCMQGDGTGGGKTPKAQRNAGALYRGNAKEREDARRKNGEGMRMAPEDASAQARAERQHDDEHAMRMMTARETRGKKDRETANKLWL